MALKNAPYKAGSRVGFMPDGYSLVPAIILTAWQGDVGHWKGDVLTEAGLLENRPLHQDYVIKERDLLETTRAAWHAVWESLEKVGA
jgi:hypothetical protein